MQPELFLILPADADAGFALEIDAALGASPVAAVLIQRGMRDEAAYRAAARALIPAIQSAGAAALIDNATDLAVELSADGVHVSSGLDDIRAALGRLKPRLIVGAGGLHTRDEAMTAGEAGIDYLFFGSLGPGPARDDVAEMANWWVENFTIPAVWFPGDAGPGDSDPDAEFLALRNSVWSAPGGPGAALAALKSQRGAA
jgi:thiamine-phosphate pyrophosphorylase